ncbi:MAG TPA: OmpA family protein [Chitinophagaceae bacterium]|nr:OmpA family protein [Chitinophagaceae bacterium]
MKSTISYFLVVPVLASLFACGTSKKLEQTTNELNQLKDVNSQQSQKITAYEADIKQLKEENIQYSKEAEDCRLAKQALAQRAENLNKALAEEGTSMKQIKQKAAVALQRFEDQGAEVTYKNGLIHINFTDDFFFKSGSSTIAVRGREALNTVAQTLRENPHVTCFIVGHTDTTHVSGKADNWSLSTERANAVVRVLHYTYNINPARLTAAGKGKYSPVASNDTPEGREKNRRIEIILNPDLDRLWELSESHK